MQSLTLARGLPDRFRAMSIDNITSLLQALDKLDQEREEVARAFESKQSFEMAYVARWSVVETLIKRIVYAEGCRSLRIQLQAWLEFIDGQTRKPPNAIRQFPIEPSKAKLPTSAELKLRYGNAKNLLELLDSTKKYRRRRNSIAHSAEPFAQRETYDEYKMKVVAAIGEMREVLGS